MTINHKDIPEANLHEVKGASTASDGEFLVADGLGGTSFEAKIINFTATLNPTTVSSQSSSEQSFTVSGLRVATDTPLAVYAGGFTAGVDIINYKITADDTITIKFINSSVSNIDPAETTYTVTVFRGV